MIDKSFIEKIEQLAATTTHEFERKTYTNKPLILLQPPMAAKFNLSSLSSVLDFCENEMEAGKHVLHIESHCQVTLWGPIDELLRRRELFVSASSETGKFNFGKYYSVENFIINLQAQFLQDDTTTNILKLVGNMTKVSEIGTKDDGVTQRVEARAGLAKVENVSVPNPVTLRPYRTFIEVDQPASNFVLRMNSDHQCALFEADGGAWQLEAMRNVKNYLDNGLKSIGKRDQVTILC